MGPMEAVGVPRLYDRRPLAMVENCFIQLFFSVKTTTYKTNSHATKVTNLGFDAV